MRFVSESDVDGRVMRVCDIRSLQIVSESVVGGRGVLLGPLSLSRGLQRWHRESVNNMRDDGDKYTGRKYVCMGIVETKKRRLISREDNKRRQTQSKERSKWAWPSLDPHGTTPTLREGALHGMVH